jgi:hypothetical protein
MNSHFSHLDRPSTSSTTSIKRSYEQFGLDHNNTLNGGSSPASSDVTNPNKRARSEGRSSAELESSGSASSGSSTRSLQSSSSTEDTSVEILNDSQSIFSLDPSDSSASSSSSSLLAFPTESSGPVPINVPAPAEDANIMAPEAYPSSWRQNSDEQSFHSVMNRASNFERNIAVLRDLPPTTPSPLSQLSPPPVPLVNLLESPIIPNSPPLSQPHSHPSYISWSARIQQEQQLQQSQSNHHSSNLHENLQSIHSDLAHLRESFGHLHSPLLDFPYPHENSSRGLRNPQSRFMPEHGLTNEGHWTHDRSLLSESLSQRMFERERMAIPTSNRRSDLPGYPGGNPRRDTFAVDRGHLPSFSRHTEGLQPGIFCCSYSLFFSTQLFADINRRSSDLVGSEWLPEGNTFRSLSSLMEFI